MLLHLLSSHLRRRLTEPLPGPEAQWRMIPTDRAGQARSVTAPEGAKKSAVLILLYPENDIVHLPLIMRTSYDGAHSAQVGLPGGRVEESDADNVATALREAQEEIGIDPRKVELLGLLSPLYIPVSNFFVQPVVGMIDHKPEFIIDSAEVAELLPTPLTDFRQPDIRMVSSVTVQGSLRMNVPGFWLHGRLIWGATAMIMSEFLEVLE